MSPARTESDPAARQVFGQTLVVLRERLGLSRSDLVEEGGVSYSSLRGVETGERAPTGKFLQRVSVPLALAPSVLPQAWRRLQDWLRETIEQDGDARMVVLAWLSELAPLCGDDVLAHSRPGAEAGEAQDQGESDLAWWQGSEIIATFDVADAGSGLTLTTSTSWAALPGRGVRRRSQTDSQWVAESGGDNELPARTRTDDLATIGDESTSEGSTRGVLFQRLMLLWDLAPTQQREMTVAYLKGLLDAGDGEPPLRPVSRKKRGLFRR